MPDPTPPPADRPPPRPGAGPPPDGGAAPAEPPRPAPTGADDAPRAPDEYLETPGSHRRPDGAATDVGA